MGHFKSNVRDIEFNLFEVFGTDRQIGVGPYSDLDVDTARGIIREAAKLAEGPLAASFADADRNPPVFDPATHSVKLPVQEVVAGPARRGVVAHRDAARAGWPAGFAHHRVGRRGAGPGRQPRAAHVHGRRAVRRISTATATRRRRIPKRFGTPSARRRASS